MLIATHLVGFGGGGGVQTLIPSGAGTAIGDMTQNGGLAAAFDGTTSQSRSVAAAKGVSSSGYNNTVGKDWGAGNTKLIDRIVVYGPNNEGFVGSGSPDNIKLQGSTDNSSWVDLGTFATTGAANNVIDNTAGITKTTAYRYHRINVNGNGGNSCSVAEVVWYELI